MRDKSAEKKPAIGAEAGTEEDAIYNAIIIACLIGIAIIAGLILTARPSEGFTELYILNYTDRPADGKLFIRYGISNHEGQGVLYDIFAKIGNDTASEELRWLRDNQTEIRETYLPFNRTGTKKVMLELDFMNQTQEVHFWTR